MKYTPDEVAKLLANRPNQPHYVKALIEKCVKAAVLAELEACANEADRQAADEPYGHAKFRCANIAAAIRARSGA